MDDADGIYYIWRSDMNQNGATGMYSVIASWKVRSLCSSYLNTN